MIDEFEGLCEARQTKSTVCLLSIKHVTAGYIGRNDEEGSHVGVMKTAASL